VAYLLDSAFLIVLNYAAAIAFSLPLGIVIGILQQTSGAAYEFGATPGPVSFVLGIGLTICFFGLAEGLFGASPAKLLLRMRVLNIDWTPCSLRRAFLRGVYRVWDGLFFGLVAYSAMKPPLHQRVGDRRAGTIVVSTRTAVPVPRRSWAGLWMALILYFLVAGLAQVAVVAAYIRSA
jgi:uncharacterized RDD family membrane protein YckC